MRYIESSDRLLSGEMEVEIRCYITLSLYWKVVEKLRHEVRQNVRDVVSDSTAIT